MAELSQGGSKLAPAWVLRSWDGRQEALGGASKGIDVPEAVLEAGISRVGLQHLAHFSGGLQAHLLGPMPALQPRDPCAGPILPGQIKLPQQLQLCFIHAQRLGLFP